MQKETFKVRNQAVPNNGKRFTKDTYQNLGSRFKSVFNKWKQKDSNEEIPSTTNEEIASQNEGRDKILFQRQERSAAPSDSSNPSSVPSFIPSTSSRPSNEEIPSTTNEEIASQNKGRDKILFQRQERSAAPSDSSNPSSVPSFIPSTSGRPSSKPSMKPSLSEKPSSSPTMHPTIDVQANCQGCLDISLEMRTDYYPGETAWELRDTISNKVTEQWSFRSDYSPNETYIHSLGKCLPCSKYKFTIFDDMEDGLWCNNDNSSCGGYSLRVNGVEISSYTGSGDRWESNSVRFSCDRLNIPSCESSRDPSIAPSSSLSPSSNPSRSPTIFVNPSLLPSNVPSVSNDPSNVQSESPSISMYPSFSPSALHTAIAIDVMVDNCPIYFNIDLELRTDNYPGDTRWIMKEISTQTMIEEVPFKSLYNETYVYMKSWSLPCGVYMFEIFDFFNDGWCYDLASCGYYKLKVNDEEISSLENNSSQWASKSISFGCGNCHPSLSAFPSQSSAPSTSTIPSSASPTVIGQNEPVSLVSPNCVNSLDVQLELKTNNYPGDTGWILKDVTNNNLIVEVPFKSLYNESHIYTESWSNLPCGTYTFAVFDSFKDGWCDYPQSCGYYKLKVNGAEISSLENDSTPWGSKSFTFSCDATIPPPPCP